MHLYNRMPDGERTRRENDDLWWMLNEELCARWVASAGWEWMVLSKLFHGDAFAEIKRQGAKINGIVPLHPLRTEQVPRMDGPRLDYVLYPEPGVGPPATDRKRVVWGKSVTVQVDLGWSRHRKK